MSRTIRTTLLVALVVASTLAVGAVGGGAAAADGAGADEAGADDVTLTVTVVDRFNNRLDSAKVIAEWEGGSTSRRTASNGKAFVDVPDDKTVTLRVEKAGYVRNNPVVIENPSEQEVEITIYSRARSTVTVTDASGEAVEGATVKLYKRGRIAAQGETGPDGTFDSGVVEQGEYRVTVVKSGYYRNETNATLRDTTSVSVRVEQGTVPVAFNVTDDHFSPPEPIVDAQVQIQNIGTLRTSSDGTQTAAVPVNSLVEITVTKPGYESKSRTISVGEQSRDVSFTINREDDLNLTVDNAQIVVGTSVRVTVTDEYGDRLEGVVITVDGEQAATTNANGVARVTLNETGEHDIRAEQGGVTSNATTVEAVEAAGEETPTATATETGTDTATATATDSSDLPVPGFGVGTALAALAGLLVVLRRR